VKVTEKVPPLRPPPGVVGIGLGGSPPGGKQPRSGIWKPAGKPGVGGGPYEQGPDAPSSHSSSGEGFF
jgi:hypothetical protein